MGIKEQWKKVKENWLLLLVVAVLLLVPLLSTPVLSNLNVFRSADTSYGGYYPGASNYAVSEMALSKSYDSSYYPTPSSDFAPEVTTRLLSKTAYLSSEITRDEFSAADSRLKEIVKLSGAILLNENVQRYGTGRTGYYFGSYQLKVETSKYTAMVEQLKGLGEIQSFSENTEDITGRYTDLEKQIKTEEERLAKYEEMYARATTISDQIQLTDLIFNQERNIQSLKDWLKGLNNEVSYSTISVSLTEESSGYVNVALVKFSELIRKLVDSFNSLLSLLFWALPYAAAVLVLWLVVRTVRKRK